MVEKKYNTTPDAVFELLTNAKWLEQRCLDLGELSASVKAKKTAKGAHLTMSRRIRRDLPAMIAKVMKPESDMTIDEQWRRTDEGYAGSLTLDLAGQPVKISAEFTLTASGKGCVYWIQHKAKCGIPLIGSAVEKFALSQVEAGCADELGYLARHLKSGKR